MDQHNDEQVNISYRIVLYQPEIPVNTGNIGRLCVGANAELHIIKPMRFFINDKYLKRAGMDYWHKVKLYIHDSMSDCLNKFPDNNVYYCTTKASNLYHEVKYQTGDLLVFGPESRGLPEDLLNLNKEKSIKIPMDKEIRSINLCNSVAIVLYEGLRQIGFSNLN